MDRSHAVVTPGRWSDRPFLFIRIDPVPNGDVCAISSRSACHVQNASALHAGDSVLAASKVRQSPSLIIATMIRPLLHVSAVGSAARRHVKGFAAMTRNDSVGAISN